MAHKILTLTGDLIMKHPVNDFKQPLLTSDSEAAALVAGLDSKNMPYEQLKLSEVGAGEKNDNNLFSGPVPQSIGSSPKLSKFLQDIGLTPQQLQDAEVSLNTLDKIVNQNYYKFLLHWLTLENIPTKAVMSLFLNERIIQSDDETSEDTKDDKKGCSFMSTYIDTRVWPKGLAIPIQSVKMLKHVYGVSGFFEGAETVVTKIWSLLLLSLLANDFYYYYTYPNERYGTTLINIFFTQSNNARLLTTSFLSNFSVSMISFATPILWGVWRAIREYRATSRVNGDAVEDVENIPEILKNYQSSFIKDMLPFLNPTLDALDQLQKILLWDNRSGLGVGKRRDLWKGLKNLSIYSWRKHSRENKVPNKIIQQHMLITLGAIAGGLDLKDFLRLKELLEKRVLSGRVSPETLNSTLIFLLQIKTEAIEQLEFHANTYKYDESNETSWYAHSLKPLPRYILANYLLWYLGLPRSKYMQPFFLLLIVATAYIKFKLAYTIIQGINIAVQQHNAKKACESDKRHIWRYMDQAADYVCSMCGDLPVFYRNIFTIQDCLGDYFRHPRTISQIQALLDRVESTDDITVLDLSNQLFPDADNGLANILPVIIDRMPTLQELYLNASSGLRIFYMDGKVNIWWMINGIPTPSLPVPSIGINGARALADFLPQTKLTTLHLGSQMLTDEGVQYLSRALPNSNLNKLILWGNNITDNGVASLAQTLSASDIKVLALAANNISNYGLGILVQVLPASKLSTLILAINNIGENGTIVLSQVLPHTNLKVLDLSVNDIGSNGMNALAQALPNSKLTVLLLGKCRIDDRGVLALAQALPFAQLETLYLEANNITCSGAAALAKSLPSASLTSLSLLANNLGDNGAAILAESLSSSQLAVLYLGANNISYFGVTALAKSLPTTQLELLDLGGNKIGNEGAMVLAPALSGSKLTVLNLSEGLIGAKGAIMLAQFLPTSNLMLLDCGGNNIGDEGVIAFAKALPASQLLSLFIGENNVGVKGATELALALPTCALTELDLGINANIGDAGAIALANALPSSALAIINLSGNNVGDLGAEGIAGILTKLPPLVRPLWIDIINPNEQRVIAQAQSNTNLEFLGLNDNAINNPGATALCRVLPQTKISINSFDLSNNSGINSQTVDINTCFISSATSLQPPLLLHVFYQFIQLTVYPGQQTYLYLRNWLADGSIFLLAQHSRAQKTAKNVVLQGTTASFESSSHTGNSNNIVTMSESKDQAEALPADLRASMLDAAKKGVAFSFVTTLSGDVLEELLKKKGFTPKQIFWSTQALTTLALLPLLGSATFITPALIVLLNKLGFSLEEAKYFAGAVTLSVSVYTAATDVVKAAAQATVTGVVNTILAGGNILDAALVLTTTGKNILYHTASCAIAPVSVAVGFMLAKLVKPAAICMVDSDAVRWCHEKSSQAVTYAANACAVKTGVYLAQNSFSFTKRALIGGASFFSASASQTTSTVSSTYQWARNRFFGPAAVTTKAAVATMAQLPKSAVPVRQTK